jgi:NTE family protein
MRPGNDAGGHLTVGVNSGAEEMAIPKNDATRSAVRKAPARARTARAAAAPADPAPTAPPDTAAAGTTAAPAPADRATAPAPAAAAAPSVKTSTTGQRKKVSLALQGGGAHGAFAWGVMDKILEDGRLEIEGLSGTSAGSMNAAVAAYGLIKGPEGAREALHQFWHSISKAGERFSPMQQTPWEKFFHGWKIEHSIANQMFKFMSHTLSPYQINPHNFNPLKDVLESVVEFKELERHSKTKLFITATNVRTGKARVFDAPEITAQVCLASACLPYLFQAVEIEGEHYWDGGFMGNPVLYPLFYHTESRDVIIVHINPIERPGPPTAIEDIFNRINEISFNTSLIKELRAVAFVQKMMDEGWIKDEYRDRMKYVLMHSIRADHAMSDLSVTTKFAWHWEFLTMLRDRGRTYAQQWLAENYDHVGVRSSVNIHKEFL